MKNNQKNKAALIDITGYNIYCAISKGKGQMGTEIRTKQTTFRTELSNKNQITIRPSKALA